MPTKAGGSKPVIVWQKNYDTDVQGSAKMHWTVTDSAGVERQVIVPRSLVHRPVELRAILTDNMAALPADPAQALAAVNAAIKLDVRDPTAGKLTDQTGWYPSTIRSAFVMPTQTIGDQNVVHSSRLAGTPPLPAYAGSLKVWRKGNKNPCRASAFLVFAFSVAFAGPTLRFYPGGKGLLFNFSGQTGAGKTSLLEAALSTIRSPASLESTQITATGLEQQARDTNDLFLGLDEFGAALSTPNQAASLIHMLAYQTREGHGKRRSSAGQQSLGFDHATWAIAVLTSSENTLDSMMGNAKREAGAQMRYVDIAVPTKEFGGTLPPLVREGKKTISTSKLATLLQKTVTQNFGVAMPVFIQKLFADPALQSKLVGYQHEFTDVLRQRSPTQQSRYLENFAKVYAAGRLAAELKIAPFNVQQITASVTKLFDATAMVQLANAENKRDAILALIEIGNDPKRCATLKKRRPIDNSDGSYRAVRFVEIDEEWLFIPTQWFNELFTATAAAKGLVEELDSALMLKKGPNAATQQHSIVGLIEGKRRLYGYQINWSKLLSFQQSHFAKTLTV